MCLLSVLPCACDGLVDFEGEEALHTAPLGLLEAAVLEQDHGGLSLEEAFIDRTGTGTLLTTSLRFEDAAGELQSVEVEVELIDGEQLIDGDILVGPNLDAVAATGGEYTFAMTAPGARRWPGGRIPYSAKTLRKYGYNFQRMMVAAMRKWQQVTGGAVRFVKRTAEKDYVYFTRRSGCFSYVGRAGGGQKLNMGSRCNYANGLHELGHAIGLHHEQQRADRDGHIRVHWQNIPKSWRRAFRKISWGRVRTRYDVRSIMHYSSHRRSRPWLTTRSGGMIWREPYLSPGDVAVVRHFYGATAAAPQSSSSSARCPPSGGTPSLGNLAGRACDYRCWGSGTRYNACAAGRWQFCLPSGVFAPCQLR